MDRFIGRRRLLHSVEKPDECCGVALGSALAEDAIEQPQSGVQARRAVADVIVGLALRNVGAQGQHRPCPVQRLNLALFIDTEDDRLRRRIEVEPDDVPQLVDKMRILGQLEPRDAMGL